MSANTVMLLTPPGVAAIAVVRLKGPGMIGFLRSHFSKSAAPGRCVHGDLTDGPRLIDDAVVVLVDEMTADLNLHGGTWVVRAAMELAQREGFTLVDAAPPLPIHALDGATPLESEVLAHLPRARTELGARVLLKQVELWTRLKQREKVSPEELQQILTDRTLDRLLDPARVAIVGPANAGKSTLANQLFAQERSITADVPGTTRDWVGEIANIDGLPILLMDTPGLRETDDAIERAAIDSSREEIGRADLVVLVLDAARPLDSEQSSLLGQFPSAIRVLNKWDRASEWARLEQPAALRTVATTGEGLDALRRLIIHSLCGSESIELDRPRCWTPRQRQIVQESLSDPNCLAEI